MANDRPSDPRAFQTGISNRRRSPGGPRLPALRVIDGEDTLGCCAIYPSEEVTIGRDPECDLVLTHHSVSRRHARITSGVDGALTLEDLGSTNGVATSRGSLTGPERVHSGDVVSVGDVTLRLDEMSLEEIRHLERAAERLRKSTQDALTGVLGRRWLDETLPGLVVRTRARGERLSALFVDVDHFKSINDTHGHAAGDRVLSVVAQILSAGVRETDRVVRYGGEEFVVLLASCDEPHALRLGERLRAGIEGHAWRQIVPAAGPITASIGAACLSGDEDPATWLGRADAAMYLAKSQGRNRVRGSKGG